MIRLDHHFSHDQSLDPDMEHAIALSIADSNVHNDGREKEVWRTPDLSSDGEFSSRVVCMTRRKFSLIVNHFFG